MQNITPTVMTSRKVKFLNRDKSSFFATLRGNIDEYFEENNLQKTGNNGLILKAVFMLSLYLVPYFILLTNDFNGWQQLGLTIVMGFGVAGVGMSVMHDAVHGSFSSNKTINEIFGGSLYLFGGNVYNWDMQHNKLHHTYTNVHHVDEDVTGKFLLRLTYDDKLKSVHRFQYIYAFFLYSLMTISFLWKDFKEIKLYNELAKEGVMKPFPREEYVKLFFGKLFYVFFICVVPILTLDISFGKWFAGFMIMHCISGLILSTVFQSAHIVEGAHHPVPDMKGNLENAWAVHQLLTTANFAGGNKLFSWFIGGLDYQVEHHLFPNISHIHYPKIAKIVEDTANQFGIPYNNKVTFWKAIVSHKRALQDLGTRLHDPLAMAS